MTLLEEYCNSIKEDIGDFPTYSDFKKWFQLNKDTFAALEENEKESNREDVALELWLELQAFYVGFIYQGHEIVSFLQFVSASEDIIFRNISSAEFIADIRYVDSPGSAKIVLDTLISIYKKLNRLTKEDFDSHFDEIKQKIANNNRYTHIYLSGEEAKVLTDIIGEENPKIPKILVQAVSKEKKSQYKMFQGHLIDEVNIGSFEEKSSLHKYGFDQKKKSQIKDDLLKSLRGFAGDY
jgi:hypothetical protein